MDSLSTILTITNSVLPVLCLFGVLLVVRKTYRVRDEIQRTLGQHAQTLGIHANSLGVHANSLGCQERLSESLSTRLSGSEGRIENLHYETQKMTYLGSHHPERLRLSSILDEKLSSIHASLDRVLFPGQVALDDYDWMHKLKNRRFPYSITAEEGLLLYKLIVDHQFTQGYEIATAFGLSSFYQGLAFQQTGGRLISVDAYVEESEEDFLYDEATAVEHAKRIQLAMENNDDKACPVGLRFAVDGAKELGISSNVEYQVAFSPDGVKPLLHDRMIDFAFIDGGHFGEQPVKDFDALHASLNPDRFLLVFHDTQCDAVALGVHHAVAKTGGDLVSLHTRNRLALVSKGLPQDQLRKLRDLLVRQHA